MAFRKLHVRGISQETYEILKSKILSGELAPGQRVDVAQTSQELGVSRTPVIESLQALSLQGLIEIIPRKGTFVPRVTPKDVEDAFQLRLALEAKACELAAAHVDAAKAANLWKINERIAQKDLDLSERLRLNGQFHRLIAEYANNSMLLKCFLEVQARMHFLEIYFERGTWRDFAPGIVQEHQAIIEALTAKRASVAQSLIIDHISASMNRLLQVIRASGDEGSATTGPSEETERSGAETPSAEQAGPILISHD
jgi:DNA-binding GntR family transcriptional regulator